MMSRICSSSLILVVLTLPPVIGPLQLQAAPLFSSEMSLYFTSGDYGTSQTTDTLTTTALLGYAPNERIRFELSASYIYSSDQSLVMSGGNFVSRRGTGMMTPPGGTTSTASQSGPGDVECAAYVNLLGETQRRPALTIYGKIKLPTADEDQGLGTGETDFTAGIQAGKWLGPWNVRADGAHVFQGENVQFLLEDYFAWEAGIGYLFNPDVLGEMFVWGATEPAEGVGPLGELHLKLTKWNGNGTGFSLYAVTGLEDNSLDYGIGGSFFASL